MAVDSTPERSLSDLFSSSRAVDATTGCGPGVAEMRRGHHRLQRRLDRPLRIGEEGGDAGERLVRLGVEDMQDGADQQRVAGLLPVIALLERAFRDRPARRRRSGRRGPPIRRGGPRAADCRRRTSRLVGSNSSTRPCCARKPAVSCPVLALDVVDDGRARPGQQRRHDQADALAGARRREAQHMLRSVMAEIVALELAEHDAIRAEQPGRLRPLGSSPSAPSHRSRRSSLRGRARPTCR